MAIALDILTEQQRRELFDKLSFEFARKKSRREGLSPSESQFWHLLTGEIARVARTGNRPLEDFLERFGGARYRACVAAFWSFVDEGCRLELVRRPARVEVLRVCIGCLVDHLAQRGAPVTPAIVLNSSEHLAHAVEQRFPGYSQARLLHRVAPIASSRV